MDFFGLRLIYDTLWSIIDFVWSIIGVGYPRRSECVLMAIGAGC